MSAGSESRALLIVQVDRKRRHVDLALRTWTGQQEGKPRQPAVGDLVAGRVVAVSGTGVRLQLGARLRGRVPLTDLHDSWRDNALEGASLQRLTVATCCSSAIIQLDNASKAWVFGLTSVKLRRSNTVLQMTFYRQHTCAPYRYDRPCLPPDRN